MRALEFIRGHVNFKLRFNQIYRLKITKVRQSILYECSSKIVFMTTINQLFSSTIIPMKDRCFFHLCVDQPQFYQLASKMKLIQAVLRTQHHTVWDHKRPSNDHWFFVRLFLGQVFIYHLYGTILVYCNFRFPQGKLGCSKMTVYFQNEKHITFSFPLLDIQ